MEGITLLVLIFALQISVAIAADSLNINQTLTFNQTLVSSNQTFQLGFFTPTNSNNNNNNNRWYLGIWFNKIQTRTVIWVANRDNPLSNPSSGALKINSNGLLTLSNETNHIIWSSSLNTTNRVNSPVFALLLDNGNLVIKSQISTNDDSNGYVWQSFDYPSDNLIEGMKFGWNLKTGLNRKLQSWKSSDDPSNGDFVYEIVPNGFPEPILRNGSVKLFRAGPWTGIQYSGTPELTNNPVFQPSFVFSNEEVYYSFKSTDGSVISRFLVDSTGSLYRLSWNSRSLQWVVMINVLKDECNKYGLCGVHGACNIDVAVLCKCLKGFVPKSVADWSSMDWSGGCRRRTGLNCSNGVGDDGFVRFSSVKVPDTTFTWVNMSMGLVECQMKCLKNCSCMAYANTDVRGSGSGCVLWFGDLIDLREFTAGGGGQDLYVRMAASELDAQQGGSKKKKNRAVAAVVSISVITGVLLVASVIWCFIARTRMMQRENINQEEESTRDLELPLLDFVTVANATNNFSYDKLIGEGGFGPVYKGILQNGQEIAVKRLSKNSGQGLREFKNEVILISKLQHRNLVRLLGCCIQRDEMMLIYEYMPNKSLDNFIFDKVRSKSLSWEKRFDIIIGIAQGLLYLHRDSRLRIIHRDLKAANILLDREMNPKISDFGLARTFGGDETQANTRRVVGTYGYMSPEYAADGLFSMKSDVFSFGVLVLEIVSGKRNKGFYLADHDFNLLGHAWNLWNEDRAMELVDEMFTNQDVSSRFVVFRCIQVGLLCVQQRPDDRPTMPTVVMMLGSESTYLPEPKHPGFYYERSFMDEGQSSSDKFSYGNKVSFTQLEGR